MSGDTTELNPSIIGTKEHWDEVYASERNNYADHGNEGEVWFGANTSRRIVQFLQSLDCLDKHEPIIDLGCGNGLLLINLSGVGFTNLLGIDFSEDAVQLARDIATNRGSSIQFEVRNILDWPVPAASFRVALDKGTYDAISLSPDDTEQKRRLYITKVHSLISPGGFLVLTSCNWTEQEIITQFSSMFQYRTTLPVPSFSFGGKSGNRATTIAFEKI